MKKIILILALTLSCGLSVMAQQQQLTPEKKQKLLNAKVKMMQLKLRLTEQQTNQFVPLYKRYQESLFAVNRPPRVENRATVTSDQAYKTALSHIKYKEKLLKVQEDYLDDFKKILTPQQLLDFGRAEAAVQQSVMRGKTSIMKDRMKKRDRKGLHKRALRTERKSAD